MKDIVRESFSLDQRQIDQFQRQGFLLLKEIFSKDFIKYIHTKIDSDIQTPSDKYQAGFNRIKFDLFNGDPSISLLMKSQAFRSVMKTLTDRTMIYTQGLGFELKKNENKGFPWHIGTQSFGYQQASDFGCTIWTPLVPIDSPGQRGGMAYVPKDAVSGDFMYTHVDPAIFGSLRTRIDSGEKIPLEEYIHLRDGPLNDPAMSKILDCFAVEDSFEIGDALIFDKHVIHRSVMLDEGPTEMRSAFAMRFICADSRYDQKRANDLEIPREYFDYAGPTSFHLEVCDKNGELIADSVFFRSDRETRTLA